jgi:hypothetical protein
VDLVARGLERPAHLLYAPPPLPREGRGRGRGGCRSE